MAKTIKFNLILDGFPVRDLEGLREHFSIEDMLKYYENGLLLRWLDVRGFKTEYTEVAKIKNSATEKEILKLLSLIFKVEMMDAVIEKNIAILEYLKKEKKLLDRYRNDNFKKERIISDYHEGYVGLIHHMQEFRYDMEMLKADAAQFILRYWKLFELDAVHLYFQLEKNAPEAVFAMLAQDEIHNVWMSNDDISKRIRTQLLDYTTIKAVLGDNAKSVKQDTYGNFKDVQPFGTKVMILWLNQSAYIRSQREEDFQLQLSANDVNGKLPILDGLKYQSDFNGAELLYMEV